MSKAVELANAVVSRINAAYFESVGTVVAGRKFVAVLDKEGISDGIAVRVVPTGNELAKEAKSTWLNSLTVGVGVTRKLSEDDSEADSEAQESMDFMDEISDLLSSEPLAFGGRRAVVEEITADPIFSQEAFLRREFIAVVSFRFKVL